MTEKLTHIPEEKLKVFKEIGQNLEKAKAEFKELQTNARVKELEALLHQRGIQVEALKLYVEFGLKLNEEFDMTTGLIKWDETLSESEVNFDR